MINESDRPQGIILSFAGRTSDQKRDPRGNRSDLKTDLAHTQTRTGGGNWGNHGNGDNANNDGRASTIPKARGGADKNRYRDLLNDED